MSRTCSAVGGGASGAGGSASALLLAAASTIAPESPGAMCLPCILLVVGRPVEEEAGDEGGCWEGRSWLCA